MVLLRRGRKQSKILAKAPRSTPVWSRPDRAVEHYEMARYGALIAWANQLGLPQAAALLNETLQEEMRADKLLTSIGATKADKMAAAKMAA
jgi:ferritin-like metal-binding protein YciE